MNHFAFGWRTALILTAGCALAAVLMGSTMYKPVPVGPAKRATVVVELFTSEGCSSCPPADELLTRLRQMQTMNGAEIVPLGFHVDYWNSLGWPDRYSTRSYTQRQEDYAVKFRGSGPYTPQMVVDGVHEFVGNDSSRAQDEIARATTQPSGANVEISMGTDGKILVRANASREGASGDVMLAVTEDDLVTHVNAGENGGRVLRHAAVVRDFHRIGKLDHGNFQGEASVKLAQDWKPKDLRVVAFVQAANGRIEGAAAVPWASLASVR